jgi:uncharacterized membrane protein
VGAGLIVNKTSLLTFRVSFISVVSFVFSLAMMHATYAAVEPIIRHYKTRLYPVWLVGFYIHAIVPLS